MIIASAFAVVMATVVIGLTAVRRAGHYRRLGAALAKTRLGQSDLVLDLARGQTPTFETSIVTLSDFLPAEQFTIVQRETERLAGAERSYVPAHKKGGTIAYETLIRDAPGIAGLYHSAALRRLVTQIVSLPVEPTPLHDQSSLSILIYDRPGDHIGWHYDHNFYRGRHFTLLLPVVNSGRAAGGLSHAQLARPER